MAAYRAEKMKLRCNPAGGYVQFVNSPKEVVLCSAPQMHRTGCLPIEGLQETKEKPVHVSLIIGPPSRVLTVANCDAVKQDAGRMQNGVPSIE